MGPASLLGILLLVGASPCATMGPAACPPGAASGACPAVVEDLHAMQVQTKPNRRLAKASEDGRARLEQPLQDGDVRVPDFEEGKEVYAEVYYKGEFYPICGHNFWDNDKGVTAICNTLGFPYGTRKNYKKEFDKQAVHVGNCDNLKTGQTLKDCGGRVFTHADGDLKDWSCAAGQEIGVSFTCHSGRGCENGDVRVKDPEEGKELYAEVFFRGQFYPICGHNFWDNDKGVDTICKLLGFQAGSRKNYKKEFDKQAVHVGNCDNLKTGQTLKDCGGRVFTHADGDLNDGSCAPGSEIGVSFTCEGGKADRATTCDPPKEDPPKEDPPREDPPKEEPKYQYTYEYTYEYYYKE